MKPNTDIKHFRAYIWGVNTSVHPDGFPLVFLLPVREMKEIGVRILAGCRNFTLAQARKHWGSDPCREEVLAWVNDRARKAKHKGYRLHERE